jgi:hypothetical protein
MMPQLVTVKIRRPERRAIRLWIPLLPILLLCSPLLILATIGGMIACLIFRINPFRAFAVAWRLFFGLRGTRVDVTQGRTAVLVAIR